MAYVGGRVTIAIDVFGFEGFLDPTDILEQQIQSMKSAAVGIVEDTASAVTTFMTDAAKTAAGLTVTMAGELLGPVGVANAPGVNPVTREVSPTTGVSTGDWAIWVGEMAVGGIVGDALVKFGARALGRAAVELGSDAFARRFDDGASFLIPESALKEFVYNPKKGGAISDVFGEGGEQFVTSKAEMDDLLRNATTRDEIMEALGVEGDAWRNDRLYRINIDPETARAIRLPTGAEGGANNKFIKGGRTSGGMSEAVIEGAPNNLTGMPEQVCE